MWYWNHVCWYHACFSLFCSSLVQFFERRTAAKRINIWFASSKAEQEVCWEQWVIKVTLVSPRTDAGMCLFLCYEVSFLCLQWLTTSILFSRCYRTSSHPTNHGIEFAESCNANYHKHYMSQRPHPSNREQREKSVPLPDYCSTKWRHLDRTYGDNTRLVILKRPSHHHHRCRL